MTTQIYIQPWDRKPIKYVWPGGYPVYYIAREGYRDETGELLFEYNNIEFMCCADCARSGRDIILIGCDVNYEDSSLYCENCDDRIESAYAEDEVIGGAQ